jgi:hypothetical protein
MRAHFRAIGFGALSVFLVGHPATAGISGAIFTTNEDGSFVNGNVYDDGEDVYLNGGPRANQNCIAAGLPNGKYYFQVTDPSGKERLSDFGHNNGVITVGAGVITGYSGTQGQGVGHCADVTVQLAPFGPTTNPGGEYKVWLTPVDSYACKEPATLCAGTFGFFSNASKTDNFKVQPPEGGGIPD